MGTQTTTPAHVESAPAPARPASGWGPLTGIVFRFAFAYWLLYSLPVILRFPGQLVSLVVTQASSVSPTPAGWLTEGMRYLAYPGSWLQQATSWLVPLVSHALLGVDVEPPTNFTGSGDRLFNYCTAFAYLVIAVAVTVAWTAAGELWRLKTRRRPNYDRLHALLRLVVRFHLMYQMIVYGAMKVWCAQFPPISDGQLEARYGDSSPMGLLWRFMQFSQPYTAITGVVEFTCGLLLISRRTTLLGALCSAGAVLQVFLLNMCYDVPVKLMSGHLLLMALTLIAPDSKRLFAFLVLGRPIEPRPVTPLVGGWPRLNRAGVVLRTVLFAAFAGLSLHQAYQSAVTRGILAPPNPAVGRWVGREFVRDGQGMPFPEQPENPPPQPVTPSKWQGGPGLPPVIRAFIGPMAVTLMFEGGSGVSLRNTSADPSALVLTRAQDGRFMARLQVSFPEPDVMVLEGPFDGQDVRMTLRRVATPQKEYLLRTRGFRWVQETPFNR